MKGISRCTWPSITIGLSGGTQLRELGQQVDGDIGIAAETDLGDAAHHAPGHHVRDHVDAASQQLARHVRVVRRTGSATARARN